MANNNFEVLAKSALDSKNFSQAYDYYSKLLESEIENPEYWINKGIAAGWLSSPSTPRFDELISCVFTAKDSYSATDEEMASATDEIIKISEVKIREILSQIDSEVNKKFDLKSTSTLTLDSVHQTGKLAIQLNIGNKYSPLLIKAINAVEKACEVPPTEHKYQSLVKEIDLVLEHS